MTNPSTTASSLVVGLARNPLAHASKALLLPALLLCCLSALGQVGTAVRELPFDFHPGDLVGVRLQVTPPPGTTNWTVREFYPNAWDLITVTNASGSNAFTGELVFGPFASDAPRTLWYQVASIQGLTNSVYFTNGTVAFNGVTNPIAGTKFLPSRNEWLFVGPQSMLYDGASGASVTGVAYGAGRWLASFRGWVITLEPGGRVTYPRAVGSYGYGYMDLSRLEHLGGLFFLFGRIQPTTPWISISDDGLSWRTAQSETGGNYPFNGIYAGAIHGMAYGNGVYVAFGDFDPVQTWTGTIFRSTNGYNWKQVYALPYKDGGHFINGITFTNGRFMAAARFGTLLTSTNGSDWTKIQPITAPGDTNSPWMNRDLLGIAYGPEGWVIPAHDNLALRSTDDGNSWTELNTTGSRNGTYWHSFYSDGRYWFSDNNIIDTTPDGISWTHNNSGLPPGVTGPVARASDDNADPLYLGASTTYGSLVASSNGVDWTTQVTGAGAGWLRYLSVTTFSNDWVISAQAMGNTGRLIPNDRSGNLWVPSLATPTASIRNDAGQWRNASVVRAAYSDMLATPGGILASGADQLNDGTLRLWAGFLAGTNYDSGAWSALPAPQRSVLVQSYKGYSAAYAYVNSSLTETPEGYDLFTEAYTYFQFNWSPRISWGHFTSTNGSDWQLRAEGLNNFTNFPGIRALAWGGGRFVAVSEGSSPDATHVITNANRIYTSTNGGAYTPVDLSGSVPDLSGEGLTSIAYGNGKFIATGNQGRILASTNGLDWTTVRASDGHHWNRVRFLSGAWAVVGNAGWVAFSADGQNWTAKTSGTESDLTDVAWQNGSYMVVGSHAMVLVSLPATAPIIVAESVVKLPGAGLQFNVTGQAGKVLDIQTSADLVHWTSLFLRTNSIGTINITDSESNQERRFYRAVQEP